ncbi:MAG: hypothetical protein KDK55_00440 [Chlamydiia bacterium]|nr:hypothetical protein [Chlamydiia bacterium]
MSLKKISLFCLLLPLVLCGSLRAGTNCSPCPSNDCCYDDCCPSFCSDWGVYADYLYWNTRRADLDYAVPWNQADSIGKVSHVCPDYQSGFRVGILKDWCDLYFDFRYTYYRNCQSSKTTNSAGGLAGTRIVGDFGQVTQGALAYARGKYELDYNVVDLLAGYRPNWCNCIDPYFFGGLKIAYIDQKYNTDYSTSITPFSTGGVRVKEKVDMSAYGVDLGFGASYDLWCCLSFFGEFSYDVLLGKFDRRTCYTTIDTGGVNDVRAKLCEDNCWRMVSVFNYRFGFSWDNIFSDCWCADLSLAIGYEFQHWFNVSDFVDYINQGETITINRNMQSLGFDGLFVRAKVTF